MKQDRHKNKCVLCESKKLVTIISDIQDWEFCVPGVYGYQKCLDCAQVQLCPMPTLDDLKSAYPVNYSCHLPEVKSRGYVYKVLEYCATRVSYRTIRAKVRANGKILDVGCGDGHFLAGVSTDRKYELFGVDFSETAIQLASNKGITAHHGLFLDLPEKPRSFDLIVMNNYLEHVLDPREELRLANQFLVPGGTLIGETPNFASVDRLIFGRYWGGNHVPRHTFQFDPKRLEYLLLSAGFKRVSVKCRLNTGTLALSIQNWMRSRGFRDSGCTKLRFGRVRYFVALLVLTLPMGILFWSIGRSGVLKFEAST